MAELAIYRKKSNTSILIRRGIGRFWLYMLTLVLVIIFAFPVYYMVIASLMTQRETELWPPLLVPQSFHWVNYIEFSQQQNLPIVRWFWNTVRLCFFTVIGSSLSATVVGYGFARFRFPLRDLLFLITLGTMMLPGQITLIPQFILFHKFKWIDTYLPLIVPHFFGGGAFFIFLMRQFVLQLPRDLDEAALIDGAGYPRILFSILAPLLMPAISTIAIIQFMGSWNDFMSPLIYLNSSKNYVLSVGLQLFQTTGDFLVRSQIQYLSAFCVIMSIPCIILFFFTQNVFVRGIATTGIKG